MRFCLLHKHKESKLDFIYTFACFFCPFASNTDSRLLLSVQQEQPLNQEAVHTFSFPFHELVRRSISICFRLAI